MALDETYRLALQSISADYVQDASRLLQWLCFCARPMTLLELGEVIAVDLGKLVFDPDLRYIETMSLLKTCGPLIKLEESQDSVETVNPENKVVRLCHESVRAFLVSNRLREFRINFAMSKLSANACLAKTCLVYIIYQADHETNTYPLLQYALQEWPGHYRKLIGRDQQEELDRLAYKLLFLEKTFGIYQRWLGKYTEVISPIYYSSLAGITGVVSMLLVEGVDPDEPPFGRWGTALGAACHAGHGDVVELLVEHGADVDTSSSEGLTPLHLAAETIGARLVSMLMENSKEDIMNRRSFDGWTVLHCAARSGKEETAQLLLDRGADVLAVDKEDLTPLDAALSQGREEIVQLLVNYGADVNAFHMKYGTHLHHAARSGDERAVRILLEVGADPNLYLEPKDFRKFAPGNPLQEAIYYGTENPRGHENIVKLLLAAGADPNNFRGFTPDTALRWAVHAGNMKILKWLLDAGADIDATPSGNFSALHSAVESEQEEMVRFLLAAGADPNVQDDHPIATPLQCAMSRRLTVMEQILRDHGAIDFREVSPASR